MGGKYFQHLSSNYTFNHLFWNQPYLFNAYKTSNNYKMLQKLAKVDHIKQYPSKKDIELNIKQHGTVYGWLNAMGWLTPKKYYILHFTYFSQLYPVYAPDACEAVSLRMALSAKGFHIPVSMRTFISRIPRSHNPNDGYTKSPYKYGDSATINPKGLIKYARRYGAKIKDLTGDSKATFVKEIKHGNPIVFEGAYQMQNTSSDHVLLLIGYRSGNPGQFLVADPFQRRSQNNKVFWVSTTDFMKIYKKSFRDEHALAVVGKLKHHKHSKKHHKKHIHYKVTYKKRHVNYLTHQFNNIYQRHQTFRANIYKPSRLYINYNQSPRINRIAQQIPTQRKWQVSNYRYPTYNGYPNYQISNNNRATYYKTSSVPNSYMNKTTRKER